MNRMHGNTTHNSKKRRVTPHIYNLKQHKISEEDRNLRYVLGTIKVLGKGTTIEICRQVNKETKAHNRTLKDEAQQLYGSHDDMLYPYQIDRYIKKRKRSHLSLRTVQRAKKTLLEYSLIHKNGKYFSLSPKASKEVRHFPHDFADHAAHTTFLLRIWTVEQSLEEMISRFGAYIFFTFIEAARPLITDGTINNRNNISILNREKLLDSWLQNAIPIRRMFDWFFTIYQTRSSARSWEIKEKTVEKLIHVFESKYPQIYKVLMEAKLDAVGEHEAKMDEKVAYLEIQKNRKLLKPGQKMVLHDFSHNRATADLVPSDWDEQLTS